MHLARLVETATWFVIGGAVAGGAVALLVRRLGGSWTCGLLALAAVPGLTLLSWRAQICADAYAVAAVGVGAWRHLVDLRAGGDLAQRARDRVGPMTPIRRWYGWRKLRNGEWVTSEGVAIGFTRRGELVRVPVAGSRAVMTLAPRRDRVRQDDLQVLAGARRDRARIRRHLHRSRRETTSSSSSCVPQRRAQAGGSVVWDPQGGTIYNPYDRGSNTEIADKLLAAEVFTEPHYQRLAQRYIGHVVRALRLAGEPVSLATVVEHMHNGRLSSLDPQDEPDGRAPAARVPRDVDAAAGARSRGRPRPARDPRRVRRRASTRPGDRLANESISASRSNAATSSSSGSRPIDDRWRRRCSAPRSSRISSRSAMSASSGEHRPGLVIIDEFSARRRAAGTSACSAAGVAPSSASCSAPRKWPISDRPRRTHSAEAAES